MIERKAVIKNERGFHLRTSTLFSKAMREFSCRVKILHDGHEYSGKSLMHLCFTNLDIGDEVTIVCDGPDEQEAITKAAELIESGFGEIEKEEGEKDG